MALLIAAVSLLFSASARGAQAPRARLAYAVGSVTIESGARKHRAKTGEALADGDAVATSLGATAVVALADGSFLKLREASRVVLRLDLRGSEALLESGSVFAKVQKLLPSAWFRVRTPTAVAAVRGTEFFTAFGRKRGKRADLWVCVNAGTVELRTSVSKEALWVPQGKGVLIKAGVDLTKPQAYDWTKTLNWNMDPARGSLEDKTDLESAYADLLDEDYR